MTSKKINDIAGSITPSAVEVPNISKPGKELAKEKLKKFIEEETKMVKGIFQFFECPSGSTKISVRKYPGIPPFEKVMTDGQEYEIPLYVARHLNGIDVTASALNGKIGTCSYPVHGFVMSDGNLKPSALGDAPGHSGIPVPIVGVQKRVKRFGFQSLEFGASAVA